MIAQIECIVKSLFSRPCMPFQIKARCSGVRYEDISPLQVYRYEECGYSTDSKLTPRVNLYFLYKTDLATPDVIHRKIFIKERILNK